jgi:hypothetical protein
MADLPMWAKILIFLIVVAIITGIVLLVIELSKNVPGYKRFGETDMAYGGDCGAAYGKTKEEGKKVCDANPNCLAFTVRKGMDNCVKNAASAAPAPSGGHTLFVKGG